MEDTWVIVPNREALNILSTEDNERIATIELNGDGLNVDNAWATARLIKSTPRLLRACNAVLLVLERGLAEDRLNGGTQDLVDELQAVMAEASGTTD